ncbi:MAG: putative beta-lysine N-acetyltransferase [Bacteroidales bacterium]|nr:putative beta-lysine N-acetyltransferase [Bacteroidales bacterium]
MEDRIERIGKESVIQHGKLNDRIYLIKLGMEDFPGILDSMRDLARENSYTKIFCKIPEWAAPYFFADGYITEAFIPGFYQGKEAVFFVSKYLNSDRLLNLENESLTNLSQLLKSSHKQDNMLNNGSLKARQLDASDVDQITGIYRKVFQSYPFPIRNPGYILKTMKENVRYFGVIKNEKLLAVASAEIDFGGRNAEMTDFATEPDHRGGKLGQGLLSKMEEEMNALDINTLYTIARLRSVPMNKIFLKHQYQYAGTLIKNTNISGSLESMNVYYKHI